MFPPARFCLVKLNANTQKADGLISAQISQVLFGMLSLHLSAQRPDFTPLPPARSCCCGGLEVEERGPRPGGQKRWARVPNEFKKSLPSHKPKGACRAERGLHLLGLHLIRCLLACRQADSPFYRLNVLGLCKQVVFRALGSAW